MKQFFSYVLAGLTGGIMAFGLIQWTGDKKIIGPDFQMEATATALSSSSSVPVVGPDFVHAAKVATSGVVHILAEESDAQALENSRKRRNPFSLDIEDFFGADIFNRNFYRKQQGSGSGVIFSKDGYIITNNHVVGFADKITVTTADGKKYVAKKVGTDPLTDLAVIKIEASNLTSLPLSNSDNLKVGEWVLAVGNPFDYLTSTVTAGIVSAKGRDLDLIEDEKSIEEFIQTDAAINPGNSGGALVTSNGELVGINTAIATPTGVFAGYSFAIPSNLVKTIVTSIIESGGNIERMNLGIGGFDVDGDLVKELDLRVRKGFYVDELDTKSPAKYAGILPGDVIVKINGKLVTGFDDIANTMKFAKRGDTLDIQVNRGGKEISLPTTLRKGL
ncbi:MAG: trypsin-like peptidase domain-containing protein [Saprospiraceae bacterium]|nr:trypsin-like peptidase domain-containing protein [Saprospiraceae bacterium]